MRRRPSPGRCICPKKPLSFPNVIAVFSLVRCELGCAAAAMARRVVSSVDVSGAVGDVPVEVRVALLTDEGVQARPLGSADILDGQGDLADDSHELEVGNFIQVADDVLDVRLRRDEHLPPHGGPPVEEHHMILVFKDRLIRVVRMPGQERAAEARLASRAGCVCLKVHRLPVGRHLHSSHRGACVCYPAARNRCAVDDTGLQAEGVSPGQVHDARSLVGRRACGMGKSRPTAALLSPGDTPSKKSSKPCAATYATSRRPRAPGVPDGAAISGEPRGVTEGTAASQMLRTSQRLARSAAIRIRTLPNWCCAGSSLVGDNQAA
jgi:hypothetical protein